MTQFENWGDYFWPGQIDDCKINKLGIHDATKLEDAERLRTAERSVEIIAGEAEIPRTFDLDHLKAIHRQLFQDVYDWAGELRATELVRPSADPDGPAHERTQRIFLDHVAEAAGYRIDWTRIADRQNQVRYTQTTNREPGLQTDR